MTERKIVLYLEQKTISDRYQKAFSRMTEYENSKLRIADYYLFNSLGNEINQVFQKVGLSKEMLLDFRKKSTDKIALVRWNTIEKHLCKLDPIEKSDMVFVRETLMYFNKKKIPVIFKIDNDVLLERLKDRYDQIAQLNLYFKDNIIIMSKNIPSIPRFLKYRIYLKNRLLIERYYPIDIEQNRMIAETIYLNENATGEMRVESNFDLQIKRVEINGQRYDTYSNSFRLPHTDK